MSKRKPARTIKARSASQTRSKAAGSGQPKGRANSKQARVPETAAGTGIVTRKLRGQRRRKTLAEDPGSTRPELRIPSGAAQTRVVSVASIRLDSRKSMRSFKGIICADISEIAVGTLITERPPHRTERAQFGHSAPTSGI